MSASEVLTSSHAQSRNPQVWRGMRYPDSDLVSLIFNHARPGRDVDVRSLAIDVGCGAGRHVRLLEDLGYRAVGIDADPEMIASARANGITAIESQVQEFIPDEPPALVVCWGFMMVIPGGPELIAPLNARLIIADWRSPGDSCFGWRGNQAIPGGQLLHNPGHPLHSCEYYFHDLDRCTIPGYERTHWQKAVRADADHHNEWFQTVHHRT